MGWRGRKREKEVEIEKVVRTERGKKDGGLVKQGRGEEWGCMVWVGMGGLLFLPRQQVGGGHCR